MCVDAAPTEDLRGLYHGGSLNGCPNHRLPPCAEAAAERVLGISMRPGSVTWYDCAGHAQVIRLSKWPHSYIVQDPGQLDCGGPPAHRASVPGRNLDDAHAPTCTAQC